MNNSVPQRGDETLLWQAAQCAALAQLPSGSSLSRWTLIVTARPCTVASPCTINVRASRSNMRCASHKSGEMMACTRVEASSSTKKANSFAVGGRCLVTTRPAVHASRPWRRPYGKETEVIFRVAQAPSIRVTGQFGEKVAVTASFAQEVLDGAFEHLMVEE